MANKIILAFSISTVSTIYSPAQAATKMSAVNLYTSPGTDPVLGQAFGLTVASDVVSDSGVTYTGEVSGPFLPGEIVTDSPGGGTATVALDENGMLFFVAGTAAGTFAHGDTITGGTSGATATVNNAAALGGPTSATPGATRVLTLNMTSEPGLPAPPPFPCRPTGPLVPPPAGPQTLPYTLTETTIDRYTRLPVTLPAPAAVVAFYSTSTLDTDGVATTPAIPAGSGAQVMTLTYKDSTGAGPFTVFTKLMGKFPAGVTLHAGSIDVAYITACFIEQTGAFENSVGQITLCALEAALPAIPADATPKDFFTGITDAAQLTILRPLVYLPPSYFALAQQQNSAPQLAGDFLVEQDSPTVLTPVSQVGVLAATNVLEFASQPGVEYEVASVYATGLKLTTAYTGLSHAEIAPAAEVSHPAQSVSDVADRVVTSASLVSPSQAAPPDSAHLTTLLAEFTLPQTTAPALTYVAVAGGPFTPGETVKGQKSNGSAAVLYDNPGVDESGVLAFTPGSVKSGFVQGETVTGQTSHATATVVVPRTLASNPLPTKLSGLYARTLSLVLGAPVVSQAIALI